MRLSLTSRRNCRRVAFALLVALVPMLTFMGHWPASVSIPGTNYYVSIPLAGAEPAGNESENHAQHCHGDAAGCSDAPAAAGVSLTQVSYDSDALALFVAGGLLIALSGLVWRPRTALTLVPQLQPPR